MCEKWIGIARGWACMGHPGCLPRRLGPHTDRKGIIDSRIEHVYLTGPGGSRKLGLSRART